MHEQGHHLPAAAPTRAVYCMWQDRACGLSAQDRLGQPLRIAMARMRVISAEGRYRVTVSGRLTGQDLGRLERLCGPALEHETPPLALRLTRVSTIDPSARAYLDRLVRRGATLQID